MSGLLGLKAQPNAQQAAGPFNSWKEWLDVAQLGILDMEPDVEAGSGGTLRSVPEAVMALSAEVLDALLASGATAEMIVAVVKADLVASARARVDRRTAAAERQRRCRARKRQSRDVSRLSRVTRVTSPQRVYIKPPTISPRPPLSR